MNKKEIALAAKKAFDAAKADTKFDPAKLSELEADWKQKQAEADAESVKGTPEVTPGEVEKLIGDSIKQHLAVLTKGQVSEDKMKQLIADAVANAKADSDNAGADKIALLGACKAAVESATLRLAATLNLNDATRTLTAGERKAVFDANDGRPQIEIPWSWSKGNLPVHGKQLLNVLMKRNINHDIPEDLLKKAMALGDATIAHFGTKALTAAGSGSGAEFVPRDLSSELYRRMYLASPVAALFAPTEIDMPTQPYDLPLVTTRPTWYLETTEGTATTESSPGTGKITLDAKKFMGKTHFSYEFEEDNVLPVLNLLQQQLSESAAAAFESALINGDDTATHMDNDTQAVAKHTDRAFKGLRKLMIAGSLGGAGGAAVPTAALIRGVKKTMGIYGRNVNDLLLLASTASENNILGIAEVLTVDKFGPQATILNGVIGRIYGIPIMVSAAMRDNVAATGVNTVAGPNTLTTLICVNKTRFLTGRRREFTVETFKDIDTQLTKVVGSFRRAFVPVETPSTTLPSVAGLINVLP